jgi:hypothetical protein
MNEEIRAFDFAASLPLMICCLESNSDTVWPTSALRVVQRPLHSNREREQNSLGCVRRDADRDAGRDFAAR